ncbi:Rz1-like lysis system protein LysC [Utexia brackfieldae]
MHSKMTHALVLLFLLMFLTSCANTQIKYVSLKIPSNLTAPCLPNLAPKNMTWGDSIIYNEQLLNVIEQCNSKLKAIRKINQ